MKLYLSSYRVPTPDDLAKLLDKPLNECSVALLPNAKDYYSKRAWDFKVGETVYYMKNLGLKADVIDLRDFDDAETLKKKLKDYELIWGLGGNTYMLRYEMQRSGFDKIIRKLLDTGIVYGGESAGALVAGESIAGVESADEPAFAEKVINDGLNLVPFVILPHVGSPDFADVPPLFREVHKNRSIIELTDAQAAVFTDSQTYNVVESQDKVKGEVE